MKKIMYVLLSLIILYLVLDYQSYYYGFGKGWLSKKIPSRYYIDYGTFDRKNQGISIMENEMNLFLIHKDDIIQLKDRGEFKIKKIIGYYFTSNNLIVEVETFTTKKEVFKVGINPIKEKWKEEYVFERASNIGKEYRYINVDKSILYFKFFRLLKNISLVLLILVLIIYFKKLIFG